MQASDYHEQLAAPLRVLQIIIVAMLLAVLIFGIVVQVTPRLDLGGFANNTADKTTETTPARPMITYIACAFAVSAFILGHIVAAIITTAGRRVIARGASARCRKAYTDVQTNTPEMTDTTMLYRVYQAKTIVGAAVFESAAIFLLIAYLLEHKPAVLILAAALLIGLAFLIPSRDRVERWIDAQARLLDADKQMLDDGSGMPFGQG